MRRRFVLLGLAASACAAPPPPPAPVAEPVRPARVLVRDFAIDPTQVQLDITPQSTAAAEEARISDAHAAQETLAATLIYRLQDMGLVAERAASGAPAVSGDVVIDGQIERVDEGDRLKRAGGGGRPEVAGLVRVLLPTPNHTVAAIGSFESSSQSTGTPGLAAGNAASAAALAGGGVRARALLQAGVTAEARRLGNVLADQLRELFAKRGWVSGAA